MTHPIERKIFIAKVGRCKNLRIRYTPNDRDVIEAYHASELPSHRIPLTSLGENQFSFAESIPWQPGDEVVVLVNYG